MHVRSHTGARDTASVGNAEADRLAKWEASQLNPPNSSMNLLQNELKYVLYNTKWEPAGDNETETESLEPIHGDIRHAARKRLSDLRLLEWGNPAQRPTRGELAHKFPTQTTQAIKNVWSRNPSSTPVTMALTCLNHVTQKSPSPSGHGMVDSPCGRCGTKTPIWV